MNANHIPILSGVVSAPHPQRRSHVLASNLLLVGLVVTYLLLIIRWEMGIALLRPTRWPYLHQVSVLISFALMAALYYAVRSGKRWTRVLVLVVVVGSLLLNVKHRTEIKSDPLNVLSWVVYSITHSWGLVLLFRRPQ